MDQPTGTHQHVEDEAYVIVKAAPRPSQKHGVTVCCAALDRASNWVRLYPVSFRYLQERQRFSRWDKVKYRWRKPRVLADDRVESRRVDDRSFEIIGSLPPSQRHQLLNRCAVTSLKAELLAKRSLALLKPEILDFRYEKRSAEEISKEVRNREFLRAQGDMFSTNEDVPLETIPYKIKYSYRDEDGEHVGTCQDWETEATYLRRRHELGSDQAALDWMMARFGDEWPKKGIALAMGTHRHHPDQWLINGVVRLDESTQGLLL